MRIKIDSYVGFFYKDTHSSQFNIVRTMQSRYTEDILPPQEDKIIKSNNAHEAVYLGRSLQPKEFNIEFSYDNLKLEQVEQMKEWLFGDKLSPFFLDENPYIYYFVKVADTPRLTFIPFEGEGGTTVYKGEGHIVFTAPNPIGFSAVKDLRGQNFDNLNEWRDASGIPEGNDYDILMKQGNGLKVELYNPGDRESNFKIRFSKSKNESVGLSVLEIKQRGNEKERVLVLDTSRLPAESNVSYCIDTHLKLIYQLNSDGEYGGKVINDIVVMGDFFDIPLGRSTMTFSNFLNNGLRVIDNKVEYNYNYY